MSTTQVEKFNAQVVDPVIVEIIRNGLFAVTEEMKTNLMRTAYNLIIYEALDFTVGLFTKEGDTVSIGLGLPMFIRGMSETVKSKIRHFGYENIHPGDILVTNDAYTTGSHLNHFTFTMPVFHEGELIGFTCCMAHWLDVGGSLGQITTDIYSEGIQIPIVKYQSAGKVNQDLLDIIAMNVRMPERALGDLRAQITAITTGERRFLELVQRYGNHDVQASILQIMDASEALARQVSPLARGRANHCSSRQPSAEGDAGNVEFHPHVPVEVGGRFAARGLALRPDDRYATMDELVAALEPFAALAILGAVKLFFFEELKRGGNFTATRQR